MTAAAPWSVKGINPKAREVAKDLARRSGMTLGEWLNRVILEDDVPEEVTSEAHFGIRPHRPLLETSKSYMAKSPLSPGSPYRPEQASPEPGRPDLARADELGRIAVAMDRLTDRIEAAETRTGLAIAGVEHSVRHAMARIEAAEREQMAVAARVDNGADRLRRVESDAAGPRSAEALRLLEARIERNEARVAEAIASEPAALIEEVVSRLGERLSVAESRTGEALESLRGSLAELDNRISSGGRGDLELRFATLADQLTRRVEDARAELAERLVSAGPGEVEARLAEMAHRLAGAEQRSARAIEAMGREVLTMADTLNRRVQSAEQRSAQAIEQVGGEIARIAGAVEQRLGRTDELHAEAIERLGSEIGRITDRLTDRIIQSERRAAQAIDDVGDQVSKVTERIEQRHERASSDLAERIRQSEERTAQILEQARLRFEVRRDEPAAPRVVAAMSATAAALDVEFVPLSPPPAPAAAEQTAAEPDRSEPAAPAVLADPPSIFGPIFSSRAEPLSQPVLDPGNPAFGEEDFEAAERFAPITDREDESSLTAEPPVAGAPALSTREVIEQARAAARAAALPPPSKWTRSPPSERRIERPRKPGRDHDGKPGGGFRFFSRKTTPTGLFGTLKNRPPSTWQTALMAAGGAAFLSVGAAGVVLTEGAGARREAPALTPVVSAPRAAVALSGPALAVAPAAAEKALEPGSQAAQFQAVQRAVEQQTPGALAQLKALADSDYAPAQYYLSKLYEDGGFGVTVNLKEARLWSARAAENGEVRAMHNLAMFFFHGDGGVADPVAAASWFRKAAERGLTDSQYNLAMLYQSGSGVARDLAQAFKWYEIAARGGDVGARAAAVELQPKLTPAQISAGEAAAARFEPGAAPVQTVSRDIAPQMSTAVARKILGRLGYFKGEADVGGSADLKVAISAYQRDHGLAATGALDAATASKLAVFTR